MDSTYVHEAWVGAGKAAPTLGCDEEGVLDADHADAGNAFLGFDGQNHPFLQGFVEALGKHGEFVDVQADAVPEELDLPVAEPHEIGLEIRVQPLEHGVNKSVKGLRRG